MTSWVVILAGNHLLIYCVQKKPIQKQLQDSQNDKLVSHFYLRMNTIARYILEQCIIISIKLKMVHIQKLNAVEYRSVY